VSRSGSSVAGTDPQGKAWDVSPQDSSGFCPYTHLEKYTQQRLFKGLVHPNMKSLSVSTHPRVVPNHYVFICSAEHKGRYLEECFNQTDLIPHSLPCTFSYYGSQWGMRSVW